MKLLILTQKIDKNDDILGFFHKWVELFAQKCEKVTVICLEKGEHNLPSNVKVLSLGKEESISRAKYIFRFYKYIWGYRKEYDKVFVHMNPEYIVLGGVFWRILGKKISLWYVHRQVSWQLISAKYISHNLFTAVPESFGLKSKKLHVIGHGIDTILFNVKSNVPNKVKKILHVGRITRIKNIHILIKALKGTEYSLDLVGDTISKEDIVYKKELENLGLKVNFVGSVPHDEIMKWYKDSDISVNLAPTGGVDKAVLESLLSGTPVFVSNMAFQAYYGEYWEDFFFTLGDSDMLRDKIKKYSDSSLEHKKEIKKFLTEKVKETSNLNNLITNIIEVM